MDAVLRAATSNLFKGRVWSGIKNLADYIGNPGCILLILLKSLILAKISPEPLMVGQVLRHRGVIPTALVRGPIAPLDEMTRRELAAVLEELYPI